MDNYDKGIATLAGGCFWCLEAVFEQLNGVELVISGYSGGHVPQPSYEQVCSEATGHAEAVQVTFDPQILSYQQILNIFFSIHDPTTPNRQEYDVGTQYRSAIFYHTQQQKAVAEDTIAGLSKTEIWSSPIVTEVTPLEMFYKAEDYHQHYYQNNEYQPYCQIIISPKLAKFRKGHMDKLKRVHQS